ncbi:CRISPR-associated endonuclease Cas9 REC1/REC2 domain-containing protein [Lactobacillus sp. R2/2]|nr:CRISPR-associated endonuclease Cas9 REC1/REC2 domain-containing protein [Lactobacillus sp. R2/2]
MTNVNQAYVDKYGEEQNFIELNENNAAAIEAVIRGKDKDKTTKQLDKAKKITKLLQSSTNKYEKNVTRQIANAIIGYKTQFETILGKDIDKNDKADWEFKLSDRDADDKLENLLPEFDDNDQYIVAEIKKLFGSIALSQIVYENMTLSQSMKCKYKDHGDDYHLLKQYIATLSDHSQVRKLLLAYDLYVNNRHGRLLEAKKSLNRIKH